MQRGVDGLRGGAAGTACDAFCVVFVGPGRHLAASEGSYKVAEWLLANGADINALDRFKRTPLEVHRRPKLDRAAPKAQGLRSVTLGLLGSAAPRSLHAAQARRVSEGPCITRYEEVLVIEKRIHFARFGAHYTTRGPYLVPMEMILPQ
jgi:Ankyrin repeats (many copies)